MAELPVRVQLSRAKGWRMPANTVKVDRTTRWGNPFHTHGDGVPMDQALAVEFFRKQIDTTGGFVGRTRHGPAFISVADIQRELRGKSLACWCRPGTPCHADVLLELANEGTQKGGGL